MNILKPKILIVDDDSRILELLKQFFTKHDFTSYTALDSKEATEIMNQEQIDLLILDVMLPNVTGFEFAKKIKEQTKKTPIILLTALSEPDDRVKGLEVGADDYITKPFDPRELLLRAKNLVELYRANVKGENKEEVIKFGNCAYNFAYKQLLINEVNIALTSTEQKLLELFINNKGGTLSRDQISQHMGGLSARSIDVQVVRLRQKIEEDVKQPKFLLTIRHEGYGLYI